MSFIGSLRVYSFFSPTVGGSRSLSTSGVMLCWILYRVIRHRWFLLSSSFSHFHLVARYISWWLIPFFRPYAILAAASCILSSRLDSSVQLLQITAPYSSIGCMYVCITFPLFFCSIFTLVLRMSTLRMALVVFSSTLCSYATCTVQCTCYLLTCYLCCILCLCILR